MDLHVQFSDASDVTIISYFGCAQDPDTYPNQATIGTDDPRWKDYYDALPEGVRWMLPIPT